MGGSGICAPFSPRSMLLGSSLLVRFLCTMWESRGSRLGPGVSSGELGAQGLEGRWPGGCLCLALLPFPEVQSQAVATAGKAPPSCLSSLTDCQRPCFLLFVVIIITNNAFIPSCLPLSKTTVVGSSSGNAGLYPTKNYHGTLHRTNGHLI